MNTATLNQNKTSKGIIPEFETTLILPLTKMRDEHYIQQLLDRVKETYKTIDQDLKTKYILAKINDCIEKIDNKSGKKTVVISVSSVEEKIVYTDAIMAERIIANEPFGIRDLADLMQPEHQYLLLLQSADNFKVFLGGQYHLTRLHATIPDNINAYKNDIAEKTENFSDSTDRKEIMLDKFIHHIDKELEMIRHQYPLPVFVVGPERMNGHFKKLSHNSKAVVDYIHGNYDDAGTYQLLRLIEPHFTDLWKHGNDSLKNKIELALNANKFSYGIEDVWSNVMHKRGNVLLVERDFTYPHNNTDGIEYPNGNTNDILPEFIKDGVDIIIEQVLESGGQVHYANAALLNDYNHIALFLYY